MAKLPALVVPLKALSSFSGWSPPEPETDYSWFDAPLEIGGITEPGFVLHGGCYLDQPDRHVSLELRLSKTPGRRKRPLERIDWRSIRGGHTNWRRAGHPLSGKRVEADTHLHAFEHNWNASTERMYGDDLPFGQEIDEELQTFEALRAYAGKRFRISNIELVTPPPWEYKLDLEQP